MQGWIKLHRQIIENEFYFSERFTKSQAWIDLLLLANHKNHTLFIRGNEINLKRGQLCYSQRTLAQLWGWNERTVKKFLNLLKKREMIHYKSTKVTTVITILNWDLYQSSTEQNTEQDTNKQECKEKVFSKKTFVSNKSKSFSDKDIKHKKFNLEEIQNG